MVILFIRRAIGGSVFFGGGEGLFIGEVEEEPELADAAGDAGFDGADGNLQDIGDFAIGAVLEVKKRDGGPVNFIHLCQGGKDLGRIHNISEVRGGRGQIVDGDVIKALLWEAGIPEPSREEGAMQGSEQPGFCL